jgi:hypothetical protein
MEVKKSEVSLVCLEGDLMQAEAKLEAEQFTAVELCELKLWEMNKKIGERK